jgi:hypothetical protein
MIHTWASHKYFVGSFSDVDFAHGFWNAVSTSSRSVYEPSQKGPILNDISCLPPDPVPMLLGPHSRGSDPKRHRCISVIMSLRVIPFVTVTPTCCVCGSYASAVVLAEGPVASSTRELSSRLVDRQRVNPHPGTRTRHPNAVAPEVGTYAASSGKKVTNPARHHHNICALL